MDSESAVMKMMSWSKYKMFSYRRETALQGGLVMAQNGRLELGDNIYGHYTSIFNHCDVIGRQNNRIYLKNAK